MEVEDQKAAIVAVFDRAAEMYERTGVEYFDRFGRRLAVARHWLPGG
jgi:hypothetical protein